jgi:hypothetical protein
MRPRKIIVVYSKYPDQAGVWVYKLNLLPNFKAVAVTVPAQLAHQYEPSAGVVPEGLLICVDEIAAAEPLLRLLPPLTSGIVVSSAEEVVHFPTYDTGHFFRLVGPLTTDVFDALKEVTHRKRGPNKGYHKPAAPTVQLATAEARS